MVSAGTRADYRRHGEKRLKPFFGRVRLSAINVQTVKAFVADQVEQVEAGALAPKTVNNALTCLSTCMKEAVSLGKIPSDPCDHVSAPARAAHRARLAPPAGDPVYVDACSEVYRPLVEVLIATGMRISEALALRWDDVDFANRVIRVYRQRTAAGEDGHTKNRASAPFLWAIAC